MKLKFRRLPLAAAAMVTCVGAHAGYQSPDGNFRLSGFGTLGETKTNTDDALYNTPGAGGGAGKSGSFTTDSKVAVQGTYSFARSISATAQVMSRLDADGQYTPSVEWAFAKWQATPNLMVRVGRIGAPYFMISDFRMVGYANLTARPNFDVYGQVPVSQVEGGDASYQMNFGDATLTSTLWGGDSKAKFSSSLIKTPVDVQIKHQVGLNLSLDLGNGLTLRAGRVVGKLSLDSDLGQQLTSGAAQIQPQLSGYAALASGASAGYAAAAGGTTPGTVTYTAAQATASAAAQATAAAASLNGMGDLVDPTGVFASFTGIGLAYDQGNWVGSLEYTKRKTKSFVSDTTGWYGNIGYRISAFTPYFGLSKIKSDRRTANSVSPTALSSTLAGTLAAGTGLYGASSSDALDAGMASLYAGVQGVLNVEKHDERAVTMGLRWDVMPSAALKFQYDRVTKSADSSGMFLVADPTQANSQAFVNEKRNVNVFSVSLDFVF